MVSKQIPKHVVIIPDGNRRWAKGKGLTIIKGHEKSAKFENIKSLLEEANKLGVKYLSVWGFSTENWGRPAMEKQFLFGLMISNLDDFKKYAKENNIRFRHLGRKDRLPRGVVSALNSLEDETKNCDGLKVQFLLDYGGRDEIIRAVRKILEEGGEIDEEKFKSYLDTAGMPDVELIIRTGGEKRLSGLMPFQASYAEIYFTDKYFPDFNPGDLSDAVKWFSERKRNFGE